MCENGSDFGNVKMLFSFEERKIWKNRIESLLIIVLKSDSAVLYFASYFAYFWGVKSFWTIFIGSDFGSVKMLFSYEERKICKK